MISSSVGDSQIEEIDRERGSVCVCMCVCVCVFERERIIVQTIMSLFKVIRAQGFCNSKILDF
jgi:hypothetical protein